VQFDHLFTKDAFLQGLVPKADEAFVPIVVGLYYTVFYA
jgi:hypothetical protein